jgi:hypothetical protein
VLEKIAWVATAVGVFVAVFAVRAANSQRRRQFETIYVQRYWALMDQLSLDAHKGCEPQSLDSSGHAAAIAAGPHVSDTDQRVVRSYLRLCEDELELRREGWISRETWAIWRTGIAAQLDRWPFKPVWYEVDKQTGPHPPDRAVHEEFELLGAFINEGEQDPLKAVPRRQRLGRSARRFITGAP